ncbi:MAG: RNA polymerase sigma factor [Planctomycetota bacterium]
MGERRGQGDLGPAAPVDADLLRAVRAGDPRAVDRWYRAEHPAVWRTCLGLLASRADADDAAQEAMLKLHDRLEAYDATKPYAAWRTCVVVNLCRDRMRRADARRRAEEGAQEVRAERPLPDPSEVASQAELQQLVRDVLVELPEREREAFVLCELEGFSNAEAALAMGVERSTVRSLTTLARRRLRERLAPRLQPRDERREGVDERS